ncbi:hypothetical protein LTR17_006391 [Elasticomyces elasticus]|nr:hypothetical protein LTR17_006391 [Elasticomyces elasticus]
MAIAEGEMEKVDPTHFRTPSTVTIGVAVLDWEMEKADTAQDAQDREIQTTDATQEEVQMDVQVNDGEAMRGKA